MKRLNIITGHYGSGKTEFAINLAISAKKCYNRSVIADLDIVNPYFRTNDAAQMLKKHGVELIASDYASTNVDIPSLPAAVASAFDIPDRFVVLDVGGDDDGACVLGRYQPKIMQEPYEMFLVINTKRPLTATAKDILNLKEQIEYASRLSVTGLVNNTNLGYEASVDDLLEGQKIVEEVAAASGLPILYVTGKKEILDQLPEYISYPKLSLDLNMNLPFMA